MHMVMPPNLLDHAYKG